MGYVGHPDELKKPPDIYKINANQFYILSTRLSSEGYLKSLLSLVHF